MDQFVCLRSKANSFESKNNLESENKIKGISKSHSKHIEFEDFHNGLFGEKYQKECDNYIIRLLIMKCIFKK